MVGTMDTIAKRLKIRRKALKLSQVQLAKKAGVGQSAIGNIEAGTRSSPRNLLGLARALGVTPEWLADGKEPMIPAGDTQSSEQPTIADSLDQLAPLLGKAKKWEKQAIQTLLSEYIEEPERGREIAAEIEGILRRGDT